MKDGPMTVTQEFRDSYERGGVVVTRRLQKLGGPRAGRSPFTVEVGHVKVRGTVEILCEEQALTLTYPQYATLVAVISALEAHPPDPGDGGMVTIRGDVIQRGAF